MSEKRPLNIDQDDVYVEVFYLTSDREHERYDKAQAIRNYAQCGNVRSDTWDLYTCICEGVLTLDQMPGECSVGVLLSYIYSMFQSKSKAGDCELCQSETEIHRGASIGDIIAIDGWAYFIDVASNFTYVGTVESLSTSPDNYSEDLPPPR